MTTVHIAKGNTTKTATKGNTTAAPANPRHIIHPPFPQK